MKIRYEGPFQGIEVPSLHITAQRGEIIDVARDVARGLIATGDWKQARASKEEEEP